MEVGNEDEAWVVITGAGRSLSKPEAPLWAAGSAFNFRTLVALACLVPAETVIEGNSSLRARPVIEYLNFVRDLGAWMEDISDKDHLRARVRGCRRLGGETIIDAQHSSQALTAALLIAPLAGSPVRIHCESSDLVAEGYIDLTLDMMRDQGAVVTRTGSSFVVDPSVYRSRLHVIPSDFTALSYLAGVVAAAREAQIIVADYQPSSLSSEKDFVAILQMLGIRTTYDPATHSLRIQRTTPQASSIEIDGRNIPTVVPALAAIVPFVEAEITVRNVAHVNNHKCPRVAVMVRELNRMGFQITPVYRGDGAVDGFSTFGRQRPAGGVAVDSHGDHRIFMSLVTAAFGAKSPTRIDGAQHLRAGFPDYLNVLTRISARWEPAHSGGEPISRLPQSVTGMR